MPLRPITCAGNKLAITLAIILTGCLASLQARPVIGFVTDFGLKNEAVGLCKGAMAAVDPEILVIDLTHDIDQYSIRHAALVLRRATVFPKGTVFVCVVDPGVGTKRRGIALETKAGYKYVGPDNGVFSLVAREQGIAGVVELDEKKVNPKWEQGTFDGRDLFSPAGALVAKTGTLESVGSKIDPDGLEMTEFSIAKWDENSEELRGEYVRTDEPYGNVWTNITADDLTSAGIAVGDCLMVKVGKYQLDLPFAVSFGYVSEGEPLAYLNSDGTFALAVNMGNFKEAYGVDEGTTISVRKINPEPKRPQ